MTLRACQIVLFLLAGAAKSFCASEDILVDPAQYARELAASVATAKTPSGRFLVSGSDRLNVYDFARWAEDLSIRFERVAGINLPEANVPLIGVHFINGDELAPGISIKAAVERGTLTHSIQVVNYESKMVEEMLGAVSYCLTASAIYSERIKSGAKTAKAVIPKWLTDGIAQNMYPEMRKRNSERMLSRWERGDMVPLRGLIEDKALDESEDDLRMGRGLLVGWLISLGKDIQAIGRIFDTLVRKGNVSVADVEALSEQAGVTSMDLGWDKWMFKQKRTVYLPGKTSLSDLAWLKRQLLISSEEFGIQLSDEVSGLLAPEDLIKLKGNAGIRAVAKSRAIQLHQKYTGKENEFRGLLEAYSKFLDGVADKKADWRLRRYLKSANEKLRDFEVEALTLRIMDAEEDKKEAVK